MNLEQDLFGWLNETHSTETGHGTGLLLVPVNSVQAEHAETAVEIMPAPEQQDDAHEPDMPDDAEAPEEEKAVAPESQDDADTAGHETEPHEQEAGAVRSINLDRTPPVTADHLNGIPRLWSFANSQDKEYSEPASAGDKHDEEPKEEHTGFALSLDEPPPEIWTRINSPVQDSAGDDEEEDYEQGMSLQGAAYIPKRKPSHGINFTQRLQKTLQVRKERAAHLKEEEEESEPRHPYIRKAAVMCGTMIASLVLSWVCLRFLQDGIAAYVGRTSAEHHEVIPEQKPVRHEETLAVESPLPPVKPADISPEQTPEPEPIIVPIPQKTPEKPSVQTKTLLTFDEALTEGNNAYNIGMYSRAIMNFHRALALRKNDIRPYIGLSASYRAKGMYFDAKRLLDEARVRFGRNPAVEMEQYYLRRE